jgi:hypothetical protein
MFFTLDITILASLVWNNKIELCCLVYLNDNKFRQKVVIKTQDETSQEVEILGVRISWLPNRWYGVVKCQVF